MSLMMFDKVKRSMRSVIELIKLNSNWKKDKRDKYLDILDSMESNMTVNKLNKKEMETFSQKQISKSNKPQRESRSCIL
mgnify:CR=1 FL=1|jgi:chromosome segregation and condensation protein ScpB|tara:strand:- start:277 stop:513 length:237 start_codon:yes stop_codon:yes gene_type:complete